MKIAIIGAGTAIGLTAGWKLSEKGHSVTVYEKSDKLGGLAAAIPMATICWKCIIIIYLQMTPL